MSISRIPEPDFFTEHQTSMDHIFEDTEDIIKSYARELQQYVDYIDGKMAYCRYIIAQYEALTSEDIENMDSTEFDNLQKKYYWCQSVYDQLKSVRVKCDEFIDLKRILESKMAELTNRADSVKWILKNTVESYYDAR